MFWIVAAAVLAVFLCASVAPTPSNRDFPTGMKLDNGYQSLVVFSLAPGLDIFEKTIQIPPEDGGDPIDTTTMLNQARMTKRPQCLVGTDEAVVVAAYDPAALLTISAMINQEQVITYIYPDGSAYAHYGYIRRREASPLTRGEPPEITLNIVETDWDPINCVEAGPVMVDGTGTGCPIC